MLNNTVDQSAGGSCLVILVAARGTAAGAARLGQPAAAARVHRRDELYPRWIGDVAVGAGNADPPGFQRLAQGFERAAVEFRQFVEEQNTIMRQRDLARASAQAAADQRRE